METVETMVFLAVAIIIGLLLFLMVRTIDFSDIIENLDKEKKQEFRKVSTEAFVSEAVTFWKGCGEGALNKSMSLYVEGDSLNKSYLFSVIRQNNYCGTLQSLSHNCGRSENVDMQPMLLPRVVRLTCDPNSKKLIIT